MKLNIMTWNTQLYEYGNEVGRKTKKINIDIFNSIIRLIDEHLEKENAIAVLQEIPYMCNITWKKHKLFKKFEEHYVNDLQYTVIYNVSSRWKQIKMTVVIAKEGLIEFGDAIINSNEKDYCNCFVSFRVIDKVRETKLHILAVHQKNDVYASDRLNNDKPKPNIILGDFNAGVYTKEYETEQFKKNRDNYKKLLDNGYTDICCGQITRIKSKYATPIDHILIDNENATPIDHILIDKENVKKANKPVIVPDVDLSDHFRISFEFEW